MPSSVSCTMAARRRISWRRNAAVAPAFRPLSPASTRTCRSTGSVSSPRRAAPSSFAPRGRLALLPPAAGRRRAPARSSDSNAAVTLRSAGIFAGSGAARRKFACVAFATRFARAGCLLRGGAIPVYPEFAASHVLALQAYSGTIRLEPAPLCAAQEVAAPVAIGFRRAGRPMHAAVRLCAWARIKLYLK